MVVPSFGTSRHFFPRSKGKVFRGSQGVNYSYEFLLPTASPRCRCSAVTARQLTTRPKAKKLAESSREPSPCVTAFPQPQPRSPHGYPQACSGQGLSSSASAQRATVASAIALASMRASFGCSDAQRRRTLRGSRSATFFRGASARIDRHFRFASLRRASRKSSVQTAMVPPVRAERLMARSTATLSTPSSAGASARSGSRTRASTCSIMWR